MGIYRFTLARVAIFYIVGESVQLVMIFGVQAKGKDLF